MVTARLHRDGVEAFPAMLAAVDAARESLCLEMYIFSPDDSGRLFADRLAAAAGRGVRVRVLADGWGSRSTPESFWGALRGAGGEFRPYRPLGSGLTLFRDHRKLLLVDGRRAFLGGMNISDEYRGGRAGRAPWRDNVLELEGLASPFLSRQFDLMWGRAAGDAPGVRVRFTEARSAVEGPVTLWASGPWDPARPVRRAWREVIRGARRRIDLAMAYFYPPGRVLRELRRAARRGVRVRLLVPARTDVRVARWAAHGLYGRLLRAGVEVWEYLPRMLHAKLAVTDDAVVAGSANLDLRSVLVNWELVAVVRDAELAAAAAAHFEEDLGEARRVDLAAWSRRPFLQRVRERLAYLVMARLDVLAARMEGRSLLG